MVTRSPLGDPLPIGPDVRCLQLARSLATRAEPRIVPRKPRRVRSSPGGSRGRVLSGVRHNSRTLPGGATPTERWPTTIHPALTSPPVEPRDGSGTPGHRPEAGGREVTYRRVRPGRSSPRPPRIGEWLPDLRGGLSSVPVDRGVRETLDQLVRRLPGVGDLPDAGWLADRLDRLHRILPEAVVRKGGMGKAIRATAGVLAISAYDTLGADPRTRAQHLADAVPGAFALGAAYVIVDDTLQDLPGEYVSVADRRWCHQAISTGLATGRPLDATDVPDHPLPRNCRSCSDGVGQPPPERYRYCTRRPRTRPDRRPPPPEASRNVPDIMVKAGMSRVIANILGRTTPDDRSLARCLNTIFLGQLKDDLRDRTEDLRAHRLTPFTCPDSWTTGNDPLYDLFAYDAYVLAEVFHGEESVADALTHFGAVKVANHLSNNPDDAEALRRRYRITPEIDRFLDLATRRPRRGLADREPAETRLKDRCGTVLGQRAQTSVDARTFVADRLPYVNDVVRRHSPPPDATGLDAVVAYAMATPGKRLRPALGLMLAESMGVDTVAVEPLVVASELFHTASLLFDDLPAQDDASLRRGRPTAHTVFDEGSVQLAAISMISSGFGLLARLDRRYPADRVTEVISYLGSALGPDRLCRGSTWTFTQNPGDRSPGRTS